MHESIENIKINVLNRHTFYGLIQPLKRKYRLSVLKIQDGVQCKSLIISFFIHCFQSPSVQAAAAEALAVMSESLSSRDAIGKLGIYRRGFFLLFHDWR